MDIASITNKEITPWEVFQNPRESTYYCIDITPIAQKLFGEDIVEKAELYYDKSKYNISMLRLMADGFKQRYNTESLYYSFTDAYEVRVYFKNGKYVCFGHDNNSVEFY